MLAAGDPRLDQLGVAARKRRSDGSGVAVDRYEELLETGREYVVIVAGNHVASGIDVDRGSMGDEALHLSHSSVADDV